MRVTAFSVSWGANIDAVLFIIIGLNEEFKNLIIWMLFWSYLIYISISEKVLVFNDLNVVLENFISIDFDGGI